MPPDGGQTPLPPMSDPLKKAVPPPQLCHVIPSPALDPLGAGHYYTGMTDFSAALIYLRVSTDEQKVSGLGLEAQEATCRKYCELRNLRVEGVFMDPGVSGRVDPLRRPGFSRLLAKDGWADGRQHAGQHVVVVSSLSRLTRRQAHLWNVLDETGLVRLRLASATEPFDTSNAMGRAMLGMLGVWAQLEADMISDRTKAALSARKARGFRLGSIPLIDTVDPIIVGKIKADRNNGKSYELIALELNLEGATGHKGKRWHGKTVQRLERQIAKRERAARRNDEAGDLDS